MRLRRREDAAPARPPARPPALTGLVPVPTYRDQPATVPVDPRGTDLDGRSCHVPVLGSGAWWLLLFLSSRCNGCRQLWEALADPGASGLVADESVLVVTRDPGEEDVKALRRLATAAVPVVLSTATWSAYRVQGPPFFALVDGRPGVTARVATEGVAWSVPQVAADVGRARRRAAGD